MAITAKRLERKNGITVLGVEVKSLLEGENLAFGLDALNPACVDLRDWVILADSLPRPRSCVISLEAEL
jgi:hypothetical protein